MPEINKESIQYCYYDSKKIAEKIQEIYEFLLNLTVERETLFPRDEINEEEYPEDCKKMVLRIKDAVIAYHGDKIAGIETSSKKRTGLLAKIMPFRNGITVVKSEYQRRGIGRNLYKIHDKYLKNQWFFWHHVTKVKNKAMLKLDESSGVINVGSDGKYSHGFRPVRDELKIFNPIAYILLMFYVARIKRARERAYSQGIARAIILSMTSF
jgi:hypothetical protein